MKLPTLEGINDAIVEYVMESVEFSQDGYIDSRHLVEDERTSADDEYIVDMLEAHRRYANTHQRRADADLKRDR
jgi:hypothetical protein